MNQIQQTIRWWRINPLVRTLAALALIGFLITVILAYLLNWEWTGLVGIPEKPKTRTAWDWLQLLIIPLVLALGAFLLNRRERRAQNDIETRRQESAQAVALEERENDRDIAEDRAREDALQRYLDRMSELVLDKKLGESDKGTVEQIVASARTLAVIRSLEGDQRGRKSQVIRFVSESNLIGEIDLSEVDLTNADLTKANLTNADLTRANLSGANLSDANLRGANLSDADLTKANLTNADLTNADLTDANLLEVDLTKANLTSANLLEVDLSGAFLTDANLSGANLRDAILKGASLFRANVNLANLTDANLRDAILSGADLSGAILIRTDLRGADLEGAENLTNQQLAQAESLVGTTLPDGTKMTEEGWEEFKKRYRQ